MQLQNIKENAPKPRRVGIRELPEEERPRERLLAFGAQALSAGELLAILIGSGSRRESALELAAMLLSREGGIAFLADCLPEELAGIRGIGNAKAARILAGIELGKRLAQRRREKPPVGMDCALQAAQRDAVVGLQNGACGQRDVFQQRQVGGGDVCGMSNANAKYPSSSSAKTGTTPVSSLFRQLRPPSKPS